MQSCLFVGNSVARTFHVQFWKFKFGVIFLLVSLFFLLVAFFVGDIFLLVLIVCLWSSVCRSCFVGGHV